MRVFLALAAVVSLGWFVAGQVRQLPSGTTVASNETVGSAPRLAVKLVGEFMPPAPALAAVAEAEPTPQPVLAEAPAVVEVERPQRTNPVALVSLDPQTSRFPSRPSDPIGVYALVLPAPMASNRGENESRWWERDGARDLTGDVNQLRSIWPALASLAPAELPSSPSSATNPAVAAAAVPPAPVIAAPVLAAPATTAESMQIAAAERPVAPVEAETRGLPAKPAEEVPAVTGSTAPPPTTTAAAAATESPAIAPARPTQRSAARANASRAQQQNLPPPPRRLAAATPQNATVTDDRPTLACASVDCGPRLLLLGVGF